MLPPFYLWAAGMSSVTSPIAERLKEVILARVVAQSDDCSSYRWEGDRLVADFKNDHMEATGILVIPEDEARELAEVIAEDQCVSFT